MSWANEEFEGVNLGDKRLTSRLVKLCEKFSEIPESPINQVCEDWAETKAAYRFFKNEKVDSDAILTAHRHKTATRTTAHNTVLALQDTSYFIYTNHPKTKGLGEISMKKGKNVNKIYSQGLVMHTCLAVTTEGVPLGLLDQKIFARKLRPDEQRKGAGGRPIHDTLPVEEKESYRWIDSLGAITAVPDETEVVTVCDRESDFYDFFKVADEIGATVLVRASQNRTINKSSRYAEKAVVKLWEHMVLQPSAGTYSIDISERIKTKRSKGRTPRSALMNVKFSTFKMNPPRNNPKHKTEVLPDIQMYAIHVLEAEPPEGDVPIEWMLLTNKPVETFEDAIKHVYWYSLRWRIEMYFKVIKSGFRVEACRLSTAERLIRYLTLVSIVAWRIFTITLVARTNPSMPCSKFLSEKEWLILSIKVMKNSDTVKSPPSIADAVTWIAKLGGYLARKNDGPPGTITLWRGWKRLADLTEGWKLATQL